LTQLAYLWRAKPTILLFPKVKRVLVNAHFRMISAIGVVVEVLERFARRYVVFSRAKSPEDWELSLPNIPNPAAPVFGFRVTFQNWTDSFFNEIIVSTSRTNRR
jgi:hypothetical protein